MSDNIERALAVELGIAGRSHATVQDILGKSCLVSYDSKYRQSSVNLHHLILHVGTLPCHQYNIMYFNSFWSALYLGLAQSSGLLELAQGHLPFGVDTRAVRTIELGGLFSAGVRSALRPQALTLMPFASAGVREYPPDRKDWRTWEKQQGAGRGAGMIVMPSWLSPTAGTTTSSASS
jgi:hypothetical protein